MTQHPKDHRKLWLEKLVKENNFTLGAELGVHEGVTYFHLLDTCPDLTMIGVDRYQGVQEKYWLNFNLKEVQYGDRSKFYRMSTVAASKKVKDGSLDFVFIDADHSYNAVSADIQAWMTKVREGGYITGHDCELPEVKKALVEIFGKNGYDTAQDEVWYVKK